MLVRTAALLVGATKQACGELKAVRPRALAGIPFGLANTAGCAAGMLSTTMVGFIVKETQSWVPVFQLMGVLYLVGTACWLALCSGDTIFPKVA